MQEFPFRLPARYEFAGERIEGGSGFVYVCQDTYLDRKVAIKVLKHVTDADSLKQEWGALRDVRSQHTAEIYDLVVAKRSGMVGLVQEFVSGATLETYAEGDIAYVDYIKTLWQIARGIADLHASNKIHRDIKPANIRFDAEQVLKLLDFGLSSDTAPDAETLAARGTRHFLGPEFYEPPPIKLTPATDVYAFGVTAWFLATKGRLPPSLKAKPPVSTLSLSSARGDLPAGLAALLDSTLNGLPPDRPDMSTVRNALERHLLIGKHRATFSHENQIIELSTPGKSIKVNKPPHSMAIRYDGFQFRVTDVQGSVFVNNIAVHAEEMLQGSCVITLGPPEMEYHRSFVTLDLSHPEVVI